MIAIMRIVMKVMTRIVMTRIMKMRMMDANEDRDEADGLAIPKDTHVQLVKMKMTTTMIMKKMMKTMMTMIDVALAEEVIVHEVRVGAGSVILKKTQKELAEIGADA